MKRDVILMLQVHMLLDKEGLASIRESRTNPYDFTAPQAFIVDENDVLRL